MGSNYWQSSQVSLPFFKLSRKSSMLFHLGMNDITSYRPRPSLPSVGLSATLLTGSFPLPRLDPPPSTCIGLPAAAAGCTLPHISWWFPIYRLVDGKPPPLRGQRVLWFRKENSCQNQPKSVHSWTIYKRSMIHRYLNGYNRDLRLGRNLNLHNGPNLLYSADIIPFLLKLNISGILIVLCLIFLWNICVLYNNKDKALWCLWQI